MAYIAYSTPKANGAVYATVVESTREGSKVKQQRIENLGRVIDVQKGIFKNRQRGVFRYTLEDGFMDADIPAPDSAGMQPAPEKLILDFGDSYVLDQYIHTLPFFHVISDIMPLQRDTLFSLLFYRMLTDKKAYCYADTWWSGNYARLLYPGARLQSQRVSEFLAALGEEALQRQFFSSYLSALYGDSEKTAGILIDSTGLENASKMSITQLNSHNGDINMEIRLIYVIDRRNGMPVYFRYCPGNIVDVSTLCTTVAELSQYGVSTDYAIVDAGYFSEDNVKELYRNGIRFVTRLAPNRKVYKQVAASELGDILSSKYAVRYGSRLVYLKKRQSMCMGIRAMPISAWTWTAAASSSSVPCSMRLMITFPQTRRMHVWQNWGLSCSFPRMTWRQRISSRCITQGSRLSRSLTLARTMRTCYHCVSSMRTRSGDT